MKRWLANIPNPRRHGASKSLSYIGHPSTHAEQWVKHLAWVNRNITDRPKATEAYTVEQLEAMGMIGIYHPTEEGGAS